MAVPVLLKGLVASATLFLYFLYFFLRTIQSFIHPFAEGPLLFPHCSSLSRGPPWGAEPGFELGPAVPDALPFELRRTLRRYLLLLFLRYGTQDHLCFMPLSDFETVEKEFP
jgi:hypothetical protein